MSAFHRWLGPWSLRLDVAYIVVIVVGWLIDHYVAIVVLYLNNFLHTLFSFEASLSSSKVYICGTIKVS
jgi:hypothetical protein